MANETRLLVSVNNGAPTASGVVSVGDAGTWAAKTISLRMAAWKSSAENDPDLAGVTRAAVGSWDNLSVGLNKAVKLTCIPPTDYFDHLMFCYQEAASFDPAAAAKICTATITRPTYNQAYVVVLDDDDTGTITFGAAATELELFNTPAGNRPRQNVEIGADGIAYRKAWATDVENEALLLQLEGYTCATSGFHKKLRKWAQYCVNVKVADGDSNTRIGAYYGALSEPVGLNSEGKTKDWPSIGLLVTDEDYN